MYRIKVWDAPGPICCIVILHAVEPPFSSRKEVGCCAAPSVNAAGPSHTGQSGQRRLACWQVGTTRRSVAAEMSGKMP